MQENFFTSFQLEPAVLHKILIDTDDNHHQIQQLLRWNKANKPPMSIVKSQFEEYLAKGDNLAQSLRRIPQVISNLIIKKTNINIFRAYLSILKDKKPIKQLNLQEVKPFWTEVNVEFLELFLDVFDLRQILTDEEHDEYIAKLIKAEKFNQCYKLAKVLGKQDKHIKILINSMGTNKSASKAADFIKQLKLDSKEYPEINQRLAKTCVRHFLKKQGWQYVEELYQENPLLIGIAVEDLIFDQRYNQALTLYLRHDLQKKDLIKKKNILEILKKKQKEEEFKILDNFLISNNNFGPSDINKFLSFSSFGFTQQNIVWVDANSENLQNILQQLEEADIVGIDTESIVGTTKLQTEKNKLALIQISTFQKIYLFDCFKLDSPLIKEFFKEYFAGDSLKVGHTLAGDIRAICEHLGIKKNVERVLDVSKIFKCLCPQQKYSNLSFISKKFLGKQICKIQTLTNWNRRPLRKNQLHYAAMDAFVVLKIYEKMKNDYGQLIDYYAEEDDLREEIENNN